MSKITNVYYERKAGTPKPCYICRMPTPTVLATIKSEDFIYTCEKHLLDPGFATLIPATTPTGPSPAEIAKVIEEHKAREARRLEKSKEKDKDSDSKDSEKEKEKAGGGGILSYFTGSDSDKDKDKDKKDSTPASPAAVTGIPSTSSPAPSNHRKFELHRAIFQMRQRELKAKEQGAKAKEVGKGLPQVPRGAF